jgi:hypothetical protein
MKYKIKIIGVPRMSCCQQEGLEQGLAEYQYVLYTYEVTLDLVKNLNIYWYKSVS